MRLIISYLAIKIVGVNLYWSRLEHLIYKLTIISLPLFFLNTIFPDIFNSMKVFFEPITNEIFYRKESQSMYWYAFFYVNTGREEIRNSGFMWEPGAFGMMLIIALIYNWTKNTIVLNRKSFIYVIAILSTFSIATYLAMSLLIIVYTLHTRKMYLIVLSAVLLVPISIYFSTIDTMLPKVDQYVEEFNSNTANEQGYTDRLEANRNIYFVMALEKATNFPIGNGVLEDEQSFKLTTKIVGINGLGNILLMWGWIGFVFVFYSVLKFCYKEPHSMIISIFLCLAMLITFYSNPVENSLILYLIVLTPYIISRKLITR